MKWSWGYSKSFEAFGLTPRQGRQVLSESYLGIGKDRQKNLLRGRMRVSSVSAAFREDVKSLGAVGTQRLRILDNIIRKNYPTFIRLEDD